jgi:hypothetical protein
MKNPVKHSSESRPINEILATATIVIAGLAPAIHHF